MNLKYLLRLLCFKLDEQKYQIRGKMYENTSFMIIPVWQCSDRSITFTNLEKNRILALFRKKYFSFNLPKVNPTLGDFFKFKIRKIIAILSVSTDVTFIKQENFKEHLFVISIFNSIGSKLLCKCCHRFLVKHKLCSITV